MTESEVVEYIESKFERSKDVRKFDDLTLSDYIQLARRPEAWKVLESVFGISDDTFGVMLEGVRKTRNKLMHFRPDIAAIERDQLRFCAEWFKNHPPVVQEDVPAGATKVVEQPGIGESTQVPEVSLPEYIEDSVIEDDGSLTEEDAVDGMLPGSPHISLGSQEDRRELLSLSQRWKALSVRRCQRQHASIALGGQTMRRRTGSPSRG